MTFKHIGSYFKAFIILLVIGIVLGLLSNIPFVGWIVAVFVGFYMLLETSLLMGAVGREMLAVETGGVQVVDTEATFDTETPSEAAPAQGEAQSADEPKPESDTPKKTPKPGKRPEGDKKD